MPLYEFKGERSQLIAYAENKGPEGMEEYRAAKNRRSIDGLAGLRSFEENERRSAPAGREVGPFGGV